MSVFYNQGLYLGTVVSQAMSETSNGNPQFVLTFNVVGKVDQTQPDTILSCQEGQRSVFMVFTEKTIDFSLEALKSIGFYKPSFSFLDPSRPDHQSFVGKEIEVWCAHKPYENELREKWTISNGGGGLNLKPIQSATMRKLDSMFGGKLKSVIPDQPPEKVTVRERIVSEGGPSDEEIPF